MKICDLHTHILPNVDDGALNIAQALEMLENAVASDVSVIVATPHCNISGYYENYVSDKLISRFEHLKSVAKNIPVRLFLGAEVRADDKLIQLLRMGKIPTINGSKYLLTEFPNEFDKDLFCNSIKDIISEGYIPIIAHPERYSAVLSDPYIVKEWLDIGSHIQITGSSITGYFGKKVQKTADFLLQNDFVCCVASDAHSIQNRSNFLLDAHSYLSLYYGKQYAEILMWENPMRICQNDSL